MTSTLSRPEQDHEVRRQVGEMLGRSASFHALPPAEQESIRRNTEAVVATLAANRLSQAASADGGGGERQRHCNDVLTWLWHVPSPHQRCRSLRCLFPLALTAAHFLYPAAQKSSF